jgi:hypothetical protein
VSAVHHQRIPRGAERSPSSAKRPVGPAEEHHLGDHGVDGAPDDLVARVVGAEQRHHLALGLDGGVARRRRGGAGASRARTSRHGSRWRANQSQA